jgi:type 1 glutamine amidotransferase
MRHGFIVALLAWACGSGPASSMMPAPTSPTSPTPPAAARVLVVTHTTGFRHDSIPIAEATIARLGRESGAFDVEYCRTADDVRRMLTPSALGNTAAVVFASTTGNLGIPDLGGFLDWIAAGHGFVGIHAASDTYHDEPRYLEMLGNEFDKHGQQSEIEAVVEGTSHPATSHLGSRYKVFDEIYRFKSNNRGRVTPLLTLDHFPPDGLPDASQPGDLPLAWTKSHGTGRVFYTALGHRIELWSDPQFQQHVLGGIRSAITH